MTCIQQYLGVVYDLLTAGSFVIRRELILMRLFLLKTKLESFNTFIALFEEIN